MHVDRAKEKTASLQLFRILQLASSNLPVGGYTFSQGLEYAIDEGWLKNGEAVEQWIEQVTFATLVYSDLPLIIRQLDSLEQRDFLASKKWNRYALAIRETHELLLTDTAMAEALLRLAKSMDIPLPDYCLVPRAELSFTSVFSVVATHMQLSKQDVCSAYAWTVIENQVLAATKLLPLGQTAAQLMLHDLSEKIAGCVNLASEVEDTSIGLSLPGLAMASAKHESQYSRLYRS